MSFKTVKLASNLIYVFDINRFPLSLSLFIQYSEKEDKYEEEIKVLNDRLKEVGASARATLSEVSEAVSVPLTCLLSFQRRRPVQNLQKGQWLSWKSP